jgi:hypothetical protein
MGGGSLLQGMVWFSAGYMIVLSGLLVVGVVCCRGGSVAGQPRTENNRSWGGLFTGQDRSRGDLTENNW